MIYYVEGTLFYKSPTFIIVETGGIGYKVNIPYSSFANFPSEGKKVRVYTYLSFKEENVSLYGFLTERERDFFLMLTSVSSIGPKSALRILSRISVKDFKKALREENLSSLLSIPGIGKKTAQRLIFELKEKIGIGEKEEGIRGTEGKMMDNAISALISLGYSQSEARKAVKNTLPALDKKEFDLAGLIKEALRHI